jgi:O-antigen/teichoic acid export membrane protein
MIVATGPLIISWRLGPEAVPPFVVLGQLTGLLATLALLPASVSDPFVAHAYSSGRLDIVIDLLFRNIRYTGALLVLGATVLAVYGKEIVTVWVGARSFAGYTALWLFVLLYVLQAHHVVHALIIIATGRVVFLPSAIGSGLINIGLGLLLVGRYGVTGMVLATVIAELLTNNWFAPWYTLTRLGIRYAAYLRQLARLLPVALVSLSVAVAAWPKVVVSTPSSLAFRLAAAIGLTILITIPAIWYGVLDASERALVLSKLARGRRERA